MRLFKNVFVSFAFQSFLLGLLLGYAEGNFVQYLPLQTVNLLKQMFPTIFGNDEQRNST